MGHKVFFFSCKIFLSEKAEVNLNYRDTYPTCRTTVSADTSRNKVTLKTSC